METEHKKYSISQSERDMNKASARHGHVTSRRALAAHLVLTFLNIGGGGVWSLLLPSNLEKSARARSHTHRLY